MTVTGSSHQDRRRPDRRRPRRGSSIRRGGKFVAGVCFALVLAVVVALAGCASPAATFDRKATELGLQRQVDDGEGLPHAVYGNARFHADHAAGLNDELHSELHIYLGSDGTPTVAGRPAADPTPRNPLMLRLMALDLAPAVYVGRPCYHGFADHPGCSRELWTTARFSPRAVASTAAVVRHILASTGFDRIVWFGYSGGGALAMLLADQFSQSQTVVTVAADLDTDAWTDFHGYGRLAGSLNPARRPPLPARIRQIHYAGSDDRIVPPAVVVDAVERAGGALVVYEGFNHVCCWEQIWPKILAEVASGDDPAASTRAGE